MAVVAPVRSTGSTFERGPRWPRWSPPRQGAVCIHPVARCDKQNGAAHDSSSYSAAISQAF